MEIVTQNKNIFRIYQIRLLDRRDERIRVISRSMVDNEKEDCYGYEIRVFTGFKSGASCSSKVQVLS